MNDVETTVFEYMKSQNRPYSALDVFNNLHKKYGKTAVVKALETLSEKNKLLEKTYGKSKIYVVHQSQFPEVDETKLQQLDNDITNLNKKLDDSKSKLSASTSVCKSLESSLTTANALSLLENLKTETSELEKRLDKLKSAAPCIDPTKKRKIHEHHKNLVGQWKKRKRMTTDLMNAVLDGYPKTKKQFLEEVGIETDEECMVSVLSMS